MTGSVQPAFYLFFPSGYVYTGDIEGDPADIDCARTKPNGTPFCDTYRISRNFITIGESDPEAFSLENGVPHRVERQRTGERPRVHPQVVGGHPQVRQVEQHARPLVGKPPHQRGFDARAEHAVAGF